MTPQECGTLWPPVDNVPLQYWTTTTLASEICATTYELLFNSCGCSQLRAFSSGRLQAQSCWEVVVSALCDPSLFKVRCKHHVDDFLINISLDIRQNWMNDVCLSRD